jgi:hypothetical protein
MTKTIQLAVCISDDIYNVSDFVIHHYSLAFTQDAVWLGKINRPIATGYINMLNEQIERGFSTFAAFVNPYSRNKVMYLAPLLYASLRSPKEKELIPPFYKELKILSKMKTWLKLGYPIECLSIEDYPDLENAVAQYSAIERKLRKLGPVSTPGYFVLEKVLEDG